MLPTDETNRPEPLTLSRPVVPIGLSVIVLILAVAAAFLFISLPDANAFNQRVEQLFIEQESLRTPNEIKLLEILAQSGTAFSDVLASYRRVIFVLLLSATALLIAALAFLVVLLGQIRRMAQVARDGIRVEVLSLNREQGLVRLNDLDLRLTPAAMEALSVLAEARLDGDTLSGAQIESMISGKPLADCDEAAGATRIKRLRDALGNQIVSQLLVRNTTGKGYWLDIERDVINMD